MTALAAIKGVLDEIQYDEIRSLEELHDPAVLQVLALANRVGGELARYGSAEAGWPALQREGRVQTAAARARYPLPDDWARMITGSVHLDGNRVFGPVSASQAAAYHSLSGGQSQPTAFGGWFRVRADDTGAPEVELMPAPTAERSLVFGYISANWVRSHDGTPKSRIASDDDRILLDEWLFSIGLRAALKTEKGMPTADRDRTEYELERSKRLAEAIGVETIRLSGGGSSRRGPMIVSTPPPPGPTRYP